MSFPTCQTHPSRKLQIVCLNQGCPHRLSLQCMVCLNLSPCMQHRWKIIETFIEEVFEACETEEARYEKRAKPVNEAPQHKQRVTELLARIDSSLGEAKKRIMQGFQEQSQAILKMLPATPSLHFKTVKDSVNEFRRSQIRELAHLNRLLKSVDPLLVCDQTGVLELKKTDSNGTTSFPQQVEEEMLAIQEKADRIVNGLEGLQDKKQTKDEFDKERQQLYTHIEELNEQIKQIPVLKQRIEDQALKIEAKNRKIVQYQSQLAEIGDLKRTASEPSETPKEVQDLLQQLQTQAQWRHNRLQKVLQLREVISKSGFNHCQNCSSDTIKYVRVLPQDDVLSMDIGVCSCQSAALINFCAIIIADQLNALGYSDKLEGEQWISMGVITQKAAQPLKKKLSIGKNSHYTRMFY